MDNHSFSSKGDPFGLRLSRGGPSGAVEEDKRTRKTTFSRKHQSLPPPTGAVFISTPPTEDDESFRRKLEKPRWTADTLPTALTVDDESPDLIRNLSEWKSPSSNAATAKENQQHQNRHHAGSNSPPIRKVDPVSPEGTLLSQLSASPVQPEPERESIRLHANNNISRRSSISTQQNQQRLASKMMNQLKTELQNTQEELLSLQSEKDKLARSYQESQRQIAAQQQEFQKLERQYQQLSEQKSTDQQQIQQQLDQKQDELTKWQATLEEQAHSIAHKKEQAARQHANWMQMQTDTVEELETTQQEQEDRLAVWEDTLNRKERALLERRTELEETQRQQALTAQQLQQELQSKQDGLHAQQRRLTGWEQRLEEHAHGLEERQKRIDQQEHAVKRAEEKVEADRAELAKAVDEIEAKNASYEAKYVLVEQALEELAQQRQVEEERLETAVQKRQEAMAQAEKIADDSEIVKQALQKKVADGQEEFQKLSKEIEGKREELNDLKTRIKLFVMEDRRSQQVTSERIKEADRQLDTILGQVQVAQKEKKAIAVAVAEQTKEHEKLVNQIREEEQQWKQAQQFLLDEEEARLSAFRSQSAAETKQTVENAAKLLENMSDSLSDKFRAAGKDLEERMQRLDRMRANLVAAIDKYKRDMEQLKREQAECQSLKEELGNRVACFASSEGREKRMREELELEVARLESLVQSERAEHMDQLKFAEESLEELRQQHRGDLRNFAERLSSAESESDTASAEIGGLRAEIDRREAEYAQERDALLKEEIRLEQQLDDATSQLKRAQELVSTLRQEKDAEKVDREKMAQLMSRLETQAAMLEKKQTETESERSRLQASTEEYQTLVKELQIQERNVSMKSHDLSQKEQQIEAEYNRLLVRQRKASIAKLVRKPWRQDREAVSAAFSKWVRATMFDMEEAKSSLMETTVKTLQRELDDMARLRLQVEKERSEVVESEKLLKARHSELETQLEASKETERRLHGDVARLEQEKKVILSQAEQQNKSEIQHISDRYDQLEDRMKQVFSQVTERESEIENKEAAMHLKEQEVQEREHRAMIQIEEANGRIRKMAEQLHHKQVDLDQKENYLASETAKCEHTQLRLQKLASELQEKAVSMTQRMDECDTLESQPKRS